MLQESKTNELEYQRLSKEEMEQRGILGRLVGICADFMSPTRNGRKYPEKLWENVFNDPIMKERIDNGVCYGELGHPADREETDMEKIAVCMAEQPRKGSDGKLRAVFDILNTPNGRILKSLCDYGSTLGISSRGSGDLETDFDGQESVNPDTYNCEGFDVVLIPAVKEARLQYVTEALDKKRYNKTLREKLTESIEKETEEHQKVVKESLDVLGINLSDNDINESFDDGSGLILLDEPENDLGITLPDRIILTDNGAYDLKKKGITGYYTWVGFEHNRNNKGMKDKVYDTIYKNIIPALCAKFNVSKKDILVQDFMNSFDMYRVVLPTTINESLLEDIINTDLDESQYKDNEVQNTESGTIVRDSVGNFVQEFPTDDEATEWIDDQELDESISLDESNLTPEEKMDLWHAGERKENIKSCSDAKLYKYREICKDKNYIREVQTIDTELQNRGLNIPEQSSQVYPKPENTKPTCVMEDGELHILFDKAGKDFISKYVSIGDIERLFTGGKEYFVVRQTDSFANKLANDLIKILNESYITESLIEAWNLPYTRIDEGWKQLDDVKWKVIDSGYGEKPKPQKNQKSYYVKTDTPKTKMWVLYELNDKDIVAEDDGTIVEELQKSLDLNKKLDKKIVDLQEKLSVSYTKEVNLQEELEKYKSKVIKLSRRLAEEKVTNDKLTVIQDKKVIAENTCKQLTESIKTKTSKITSLKESVNKKKEQIVSLNEQVQQLMSTLDERNSQFESLTEKYETLNKDYQQFKENYSKKLEQQNSLVEKYRGIAVKSVNKYIDTQATRLGISSEEIKNRLPESYSFTDIDRICEDLQEYKLNISNLPFTTSGRLNEGMRIKATNMNQKTLVPVEDDIDELTLRLAGLK